MIFTFNEFVVKYSIAEVVKLADTLALGASARKSMRVQLPPSAQIKLIYLWRQIGL